MNGRVGQLDCRYQVVGPRDSAPAVTARLDCLARTRLPDVLADALDQALGDDPTVYVLRRVESRVILGGGERDLDAHLAGAWGARLARDVVKLLARNPRDGAEVVRFDDDAEYVGSFVADLLAGRAWQRWFYGSFSSLRPLDTLGALRAVLDEHRELLEPVLHVVHRLGSLERLLAVADDALLELLWRGVPERIAGQDLETHRPVFLTALRLADQLCLWLGPRPDVESLWRAYQATTPLPTSWRDQRELTATLIDVLRWLSERSHIGRPVGDVAVYRSRLDHALGDLDWLETRTVRSWLERIFFSPEEEHAGLPVRPPGHVSTPRQQELLADLTALLEAGGARLVPSLVDSTSNALRLHTALVAACPRWRDDPMVKGMIERLLSAARQAVHGFPADLGAEAAAVVTAFTVQAGLDVKGIESSCAGVFLLLRTAFDARLPELVEQVGYPPLGAVLLTLGLRWAGPVAVNGERIDPGLALLGGVDSVEAVRAFWQNVPAERHRRWLEALLVDGDGFGDGLEALRDGQLDLPEADAALALTAATLLRQWARWLRGFSGSSVPFLLDNFIRRPGRIVRTGDDLVVTPERRPLDVVLSLAGYTDELKLAALWGRGRMRFEVIES